MAKVLQPAVANIFLQNLRYNARLLREMCGEHPFFCAMVKADAYGHGAVPIAKTLLDEGVNQFGVARITEAQTLRSAGLANCEILLFDPLIDQATANHIMDLSVTPVVSNWESLRILQSSIKKQNIPIHIKFNTGMNRLGFSVHEAGKISDYLKTNTGLTLKGVCSHLLAGDDFGENESRTITQMNILKNILNYFTGLDISVHILNSSGVLALHSHREKNTFWGARPGLSLYGVKTELMTTNQAAQERWRSIELKPVMQVETVVSHTQKIAKGETVSYGGHFVTKRETTLAVLPIGYADGYTRHFSNKGYALFRGKPVKITGSVCMDFTMVDVTDLDLIEKCQSGESVVVLGKQQGACILAEDLAKIINTNPYEILTNFSARIPRIYK